MNQDYYRYLQSLHKVRLTDACYIAYGFNPTAIPDRLNLSMSPEDMELFEKLHASLVSSKSNPKYFSDTSNQDTVFLDEFATWCLAIGLRIPDELAVLAKTDVLTAPLTDGKVISSSDAAQSATCETMGVRVPVLTQQNSAILNWLKDNKHSPKILPVPPSGKAGVKKVCRDSLCENSKQLFSSTSVFDTAWERLRASGEIIDAKR